MTTYTSVNAASFVAHSLGVNAGLDHTSTAYGDVSAVGSAMTYLGLQNMRVTIATSEPAALATLASQGMHFDVERDPQWISDAEFHSRIDQLQSAHPGSIIAIEGMNEVDGWTTIQAATTEQAALRSMLQSDPLFAGVPLYNFSLGSIDNPSLYQQVGNVSAYADAQPTHVYFGGGQPLASLEVALADEQITVPGGPNVVTEIGASTSSTVSWGVDQATQAKQILNAVMDGARTGTTMYLYELVDNTASGSTGLNPHWGLFNSDWTPKPAATALHNLTTILTAGADPNAAPDSFSYSLSGLPWKGEAVMGSGYSMVFEKTAAIHDIAVWAEPSIWNDSTHAEVTAPSEQVTVSLGSTYASVDVYDPLVGTSPIQHLTSVSSVTVTVSDHPLIIEVSSAAAPASGGGSTDPVDPPAQSSGVTVSGSDPTTYTGTANADTMTGADGAHNALFGGDGADSITGGTGFDQVNGNKGDDVILGRSTVGDWLSGGQGDDLIDASASSGNNIVNGNLGGDTLTGGSGADTLRGGQGDDLIHVGSGNAWISGDLGNNTIYGGQGMDTFHATAGHDSITGWHAGDHVLVDSGVTVATAQVGADVHVTFSTGGEIDLLDTQVAALQAGWIVSA